MPLCCLLQSGRSVQHVSGCGDGAARTLEQQLGARGLQDVHGPQLLQPRHQHRETPSVGQNTGQHDAVPSVGQNTGQHDAVPSVGQNTGQHDAVPSVGQNTG